jgi:hypothetical protein
MYSHKLLYHIETHTYSSYTQLLFPLCASVDLDPLADDLCSLFSSTLLPGPATPTIHSSQYGITISVRLHSFISALLLFSYIFKYQLAQTKQQF